MTRIEAGSIEVLIKKTLWPFFQLQAAAKNVFEVIISIAGVQIRMRASYVRAPERPLLEKTIDQVVRETAERFPDREGDGREFREFCQTQTA